MSGAQKAHPSLTLDETVHQRVRLGILAILSEATECTFPMGRRPCTWLALTRQGSRALRDEIAALEQPVRRLRRTQPADTGDVPAQSIQIDETGQASRSRVGAYVIARSGLETTLSVVREVCGSFILRRS